jgi:hypothetical protein
MAAVFGCSQQGKQTLIYRNFEYWRERDNVCGTTSWRCRNWKRLNCKARVVTSGVRVVGERQPDHTHAGNNATALARAAVGKMKENMSELTATPSSSQSAVSTTVTDEVLMALPRRSLLTRTLQRSRQKANAGANGENQLPPVPIDLTFTIPTQYADMVLFDSGSGDNRIILMGCLELLDSLARAEVWLADGTFKVVPSLYFQLYSIHFSFGSGINPAALYCLLNNKTAATYGVVLRELRRLVPLAAPRTVLVDFERAAMNAFRVAFPDATVTGCYFHLTQSVIRKVQEIGLKVQYEGDNEVRGFVRCLAALAFVPPEDVVEAFELVAETMPDVEHLDELTTFFEHTYVRGRRLRGRGETFGPALFPLETWNQYSAGSSGIARTTNSVEGWHHGLQSLFQCHHPTLWTFMEGLKRDMQKQMTVFLQGATGVEHPAAKRYRLLHTRVQRAVAAYGRAEILIYVRAMAHLSHK